MFALGMTTLAVVLISAICSLCEAVLYSVPPAHVESLKAQGKPAGKALAKLRERVDEPITAILTLNTVANTAGAAVAGSLAGKALGDNNLILFSAGLTLCILFFSEILPKTFGVVYSRSISSWIARPLALLVTAMTPVIWAVSLITRKISGGATDQGDSHAEIISLARLGTRKGTIDADEAAVIQNVLRLSETPARSIMTPRTVVFSLSVDADIAEVCADERVMIHTRVPVYDGEVDDIVGMVFRRDLLAADTSKKKRVGQLVRPVAFVTEQEPINHVLEVLLEHQQHLLVVLDEFGGFAGVLTLEDVMEEILGKEIVDESDVEEDMRVLAVQRREAALQRMRQR